MTKSELLEKGIINDCTRLPDDPRNSSLILLFADRYKQPCELKNQQIVNKYKDFKPEVPPKEWWRSASKDEYQFCLHDKGL